MGSFTKISRKHRLTHILEDHDQECDRILFSVLPSRVPSTEPATAGRRLWQRPSDRDREKRRRLLESGWVQQLPLPCGRSSWVHETLVRGPSHLGGGGGGATSASATVATFSVSLSR